MSVLASIPSPSSGTLEIGPLNLNAYGLMIALGVVVAVWLFGRRLEAKGIGTREDANAIAVWGVIAGIVGARLYHVVTDWERYRDNLGDVVKVWEGGLGIPGGMLAGVLAGVYAGYRRGIPLGPGLNAVAPALPLAQAIGRWGNYFNQELYGRPTDLPWGLEIDPSKYPTGQTYPPGTTFHPTFLYESLWNFGLCFLLIWIDRRFRPAGGRLLAMYVLGYGVGRFWIEGLRIDTADHLGGLRWNQWVALACVAGGAIYLLATMHKPKDPVLPPITAADRAARLAAASTTAADDDSDDDDLDDAELEVAQAVGALDETGDGEPPPPGPGSEDPAGDDDDALADLEEVQAAADDSAVGEVFVTEELDTEADRPAT